MIDINWFYDLQRKSALSLRSKIGVANGVVLVAKGQGMAFTGAGGLPKQLTRTVVRTALNEQIMEHLVIKK